MCVCVSIVLEPCVALKLAAGSTDECLVAEKVGC